MKYLVRWFDAAAATVREEAVEADSQAALALHFESAGHVVLSVESAARDASSRGAGLDVAWWCRELRTLLNAGMTVVEALETLHAQPLGRARAQVHAALVNHLRQGRALSDAMQAVGAFPAVLVAGVKASERTSALEEALDDYLRYDEVLQRLRKQVISAAIYPAIVVTLGATITLFLLVFVIPRFSRMYGDLHGPVSLTTHMLVATSRALAEHGPMIAAMAIAALACLVLAWRYGLVGRLAGQFADWFTPLRTRIDEFRLAKLFQSLALMFRGGYALDDALGHCVSLGLGVRLGTSVAVAQAALARGQRVSSAFAEAGLTDIVSQRLLAVGERTGNFDRVLQTVADRHAANFTTFVERATRVVEPVLLMLVAMVVGGIVVAMYMPVFDIASSVR